MRRKTICILAAFGAVLGGGILLAHSYIQNNLPEGFAVPETRQELAVVLDRLNLI